MNVIKKKKSNRKGKIKNKGFKEEQKRSGKRLIIIRRTVKTSDIPRFPDLPYIPNCNVSHERNVVKFHSLRSKGKSDF